MKNRNILKLIPGLLVALVTLVCSSCTEYSRVLKSTDIDYKFDYAKRAYDQGKWLQTATILTDLINPLKGSSKGEEALYLLAMSHYMNKDYMNAGVYFKTTIPVIPRVSMPKTAASMPVMVTTSIRPTLSWTRLKLSMAFVNSKAS